MIATTNVLRVTFTRVENFTLTAALAAVGVMTALHMDLVLVVGGEVLRSVDAPLVEILT